MNHKRNILFDFDDIVIEPSVISSINSRSEVSVFNKIRFLPLMTAPMDTVIDENNLELFKQNDILPVLPRKSKIDDSYISHSHFLSYSIEQFNFLFIENGKLDLEDPVLALIDVANGHMEKLLQTAIKSKSLYGDKLILMVGNIANPKTFEKYLDVADFVRCGIGNGNACTTTANTSIGYPMASLIQNCYSIKGGSQTKIVADGGFKKYSDIIKALALGADYVMLGSMLNKALESCGETLSETSTEKVDQYSIETLDRFKNGEKFYKRFRGMSTKEVQKAWGKTKLTTSEGVVKLNPVEYTISGWVDNFKDYLSSAMSYTDSRTLDDFVGQVEFSLITQNAFNRFNK